MAEMWRILETPKNRLTRDSWQEDAIRICVQRKVVPRFEQETLLVLRSLNLRLLSLDSTNFDLNFETQEVSEVCLSVVKWRQR